ncbi:primosomal protein N' (replication factor Y) - superfamily II helicase [Chania multitudinisentens RB-25]|uniref:Primosomal protein N' (Replication factor Y)-superfamily II helicase n=1 Tax=Chania multitudinisentens RB-25 TaxID=1441930 RepID=W0L5N8_9GAMM|nr:zinc ribbon domain-containing protein [Chania multitudinisentens]AHG19026.1 primosomal protein N' (replication factor Y) - superfamily II helicase [Chania multitudinisentens RB-25]
MDASCPRCAQVMNWVNGHYHCDTCNSDYRQLAECPDCGRPLQELKACGAVDYLCQNGHGLISKKRVKFSYWPI